MTGKVALISGGARGEDLFGEGPPPGGWPPADCGGRREVERLAHGDPGPGRADAYH